MKIPLTRNRVALVDNEDYERLSKYKWLCLWDGDKKNGKFYAYRMNKQRKAISMAREVLCTKERVDHIDHNTLNNCRSNLRVCTDAENQWNQVIREGGTSQYKGVHWHKYNKKWVARISVHTRRIYLGMFHDEAMAALAYDGAAAKYFGEFCLLNFGKLTKELT